MSLFNRTFTDPDKVDSSYIKIKEITNSSRRQKIENAYDRCKQFLDRNFEKEFPLAGQFFSRLWELFVCDTLKGSKLGGNLKPTNGEGPDFLLENVEDGKNIYIECVCPQDTTKPGLIQNESFKREEETLEPLYIEGFQKPVQRWSSWSEGYDERIVSRYSSSLKDKSEKFTDKYPLTNNHYRVLCVSGVALSLLKQKYHPSDYADSLSTKEDFQVAIAGNHQVLFPKDGHPVVKSKPVTIQKGEESFEVGNQEYLNGYHAIVFCDEDITDFNRPHFEVFFNGNMDLSEAFQHLLKEIFQIGQ